MELHQVSPEGGRDDVLELSHATSQRQHWLATEPGLKSKPSSMEWGARVHCKRHANHSADERFCNSKTQEFRAVLGSGGTLAQGKSVGGELGGEATIWDAFLKRGQSPLPQAAAENTPCCVSASVHGARSVCGDLRQSTSGCF